MSTDWLFELKAGDEVGVSYRHNRVRVISTVERVTKTQIIVDGIKYRRCSGLQITSDSWNLNRLVPATDKLRAELSQLRRRVNALQIIDSMRFDSHETRQSIPVEHLEEIAAKIKWLGYGAQK